MNLTLVEVLIIAAIVLIVSIVGIALWEDAKSPTFELRKDEWTCVREHKQMRLIPAGKVMVPQNYTVCDQWNRNGR